MKLVLRIFTLALFVVAASGALFADSRGDALKRAERELRNGNFDEAEASFRRLIEQNPKDKEAHLGLSFVLIKKLRLQEAYAEATRVMDADPLNGRAYALMGTALVKSGELRAAVAALGRALQLNDRDGLALAGMAEIAYFENQAQQSYDWLRRAIQIDPREPDNYPALARTCSRLEFYLEAAKAYQGFLQYAPKTDAERRARVQGLIDFFRYLGTTKIHRLGGQEVAEVPFELRRNRPYVNVLINGQGPFRLVIDTGASMSVLSEQAAVRLGLRPVARGGNGRGIGGTGTFPLVYGLLESISLGGAKIERVPVYLRTLHATPNTPAEERADGYIGLSVLAKYSVTLDYQKQTLTLDRTAPPREAAGQPLASEAATEKSSEVPVSIRSTSGGLASAEAHLAATAQPLNFIIDTGATTTVISKASVKRFGLDQLIIPDERIQVIGAAGIEDDVSLLGLATLTVNGLRQSNARALILNLDPVNETSGFEQHGILGGDFLRHFRVQLDLRRYQLRLTPQGAGIKLVTDQRP